MLAISSDGRTMATGGRDWRLLRWDAATRRSVETESRHDSPVGAIALTPDGRIVITGRRAGRLHIWDAETETGFDLPRQGTEVKSLAVSPDGRVLASGTEGGVVRLWDTSLLGPIGQTCKFAAPSPPSRSTHAGGSWRSEGKTAPSGSSRCHVRRPSGGLSGLTSPVLTVTFGDSGRRLLIGTTEGSRWLDLAGRTWPVSRTRVEPIG